MTRFEGIETESSVGCVTGMSPIIETMTRFEGIETQLGYREHPTCRLKQWPDLRGLRLFEGSCFLSPGIETMTRFEGIETASIETNSLIPPPLLKQWPDLRGLRPSPMGGYNYLYPELKQWPDLRGLRHCSESRCKLLVNIIETMTRFEGIETYSPRSPFHNLSYHLLKQWPDLRGLRPVFQQPNLRCQVIETMTRFEGIETVLHL